MADGIRPSTSIIPAALTRVAIDRAPRLASSAHRQPTLLLVPLMRSSRNKGFCASFACRSTQRIRTDQPEQRQAAEQAAEGSDALGVGAGTRAPSTASGLRDYFRSPQYRIVSDDPCIL